MINYGLKDRVAIVTGANNPWGIGATSALAFAREGANAGDADDVESKLKEIKADYIILESDISDESSVKEIYSTVLEKYGRVTVNCVSPGPTQTGWIDEEFEKVVIPLIPMGKLIQPEDIAETILFLASEQAKMITGQVIKVSGGKAL